MGPGCGGRGKGKPVWPPGESSSLLTSHFQALAVSCEEESDFTGTDSGQHPKVDRCHDHSSSCREVNSENMSLMGGGGGVAGHSPGGPWWLGAHIQLLLIDLLRGLGLLLLGQVFKHEAQHVHDLVVQLLKPGRGGGGPQLTVSSAPPGPAPCMLTPACPPYLAGMGQERAQI